MRILGCLALAAVLVPLSLPQSHRRNSGAPSAPGVFDYYLLSLSWAPDFCAGPNGRQDSLECAPGRRVGFVVHGLWPQLDNGDHPSQCAKARPVAQDIVKGTLPYIPDPGLIQHEWRDHGTCSGLSPAAYFDTVRRAADSVKIPDEFRQLNQRITDSPRDIAAKFVAANPGLRDSIRVTCSGGELAEVRVCLGKDLSPHACGVHDSNCPAPSVTILPLR